MRSRRARRGSSPARTPTTSRRSRCAWATRTPRSPAPRWCSASASRYPRQTAAALETRGLVAVPPDPRGGELHLIGSTKCIHINRTILAPIFGIPLGALRLTEVDVGGGFGVRGELYPEDILVPLAAMKLGRPVKWIESRRENLMATNHAREVAYEIEIGFDGDGRIAGDARGDPRRHRRLRPHGRARAGRVRRRAAAGPLSRAELRVRSLVGRDQQDAGRHAALARPAGVQLRARAPDGPGGRAARPRSGRDPAPQPDPAGRDAVRLRHQVVRREHGLRLRRLPGAVRRAAARAWTTPRARAEQAALNARPSGRAAGIGLAVYVEKTGLGPFETTQVEARPDGRFVVDTGASSMGPGLETVLAQILGEALGLPAATLRRPPRRHRRGRERRRHLRLARHRDRRQRGAPRGGEADRRGAAARGRAVGRAGERGDVRRAAR